MKSLSQAMVGVMLAIAGGSFLYIAASDLIPETHEEKGFENSGFLLIGVICLYLLSKTIGG
jgi:zinc transporter ZupT